MLCIACVCCAQEFRIIGYLPYYRMSFIGGIEFQRLTHVNIAFANPNVAGDLDCGGVNIDPAIVAAHAAGCKVFVSLGGGALRPEWETAWDSLTQPANRAAFIEKIINYVNTHQFDGVDMDLEWQYVKDWYSPFVIDLKRALRPLGLPLTAALPGSHRYAHISDSGLAAFDWVNMMIYDLTGPWDPSNPGQHSPMNWTSQCIAYWKSQDVPSTKLTVGVPFYGYDFGASPVVSRTYGQLVKTDPANAYRDSIDSTYWNGIPTIKAKTQLALAQSSGIMIWELGQDAFGANAAFSLLRAIDSEVRQTPSGLDMAEDDRIVVYPNPVMERLAIRNMSVVNEVSQTITRVIVRDALGHVIVDNSGPVETRHIDTHAWTPGAYYVSVHTTTSVSNTMIVKL